MRYSDPNASFLLKNMVNTGRVGQEQTGMAWARHKSNPKASVGRRSANLIQRARQRE